MLQVIKKISPKYRLYFTVLLTVLVPVLLITVFGIYHSKLNTEETLKKNLDLQIQTIKKMFEREHALKLSKVQNDLKVLHYNFYKKPIIFSKDTINIAVENQLNRQKHRAEINIWEYDNSAIYLNNTFVNENQRLLGGTQTIFQRFDSGFVRISTNVKKENGKYAIGTYIPNSSEVCQTILKGEKYIGRAYVVNDWYITAYEPIFHKNKVVGMLYSGDKEKDLPELKEKLENLKIGETGKLMVVNDKNEIIIGRKDDLTENELDFILNSSIENPKKFIFIPKEISKRNILSIYDTFSDFKLRIFISISLKKEAQKSTNNLIFYSSILAVLIVLVFSVLVYLLNTDNVRHFYLQMEKSAKKLSRTEQKLDETRRDFRTLFDSNSDDVFVTDEKGKIIELNQMACDSFEDIRENLLGKNISDILSENNRNELYKKFSEAYSFGKTTFESEYQFKNGDILPVELKTKVVDYQGQKLLLTTVRDIRERKEIEEKILTTIIQTEENERKRFSADLHDDLGPILSTVKLYTSLLTKNENKGIKNEDNIKTIEELTDNAIQTTRAISRNIRPSILQDFGLAAAIEEFCSYIKKTKAINISLTTQNYKIEKRGIEETILYHTAKELINNTLRYANAENIKLDLKSFENQVIFYYRDDGIGFDLELMKRVPKGLGLNNIVNKIKSIKGSVDLHSEPGKGMFLVASVKINPNL